MGTKSSSSGAVRVLLRISVTILIIGINIIFYAAVIYGIKKAADYSYDFAYRIFGDVSVEAAPGRDVKVQILKGETSMNVAQKLEDSRVIVDKYSFYLKMKLKKYSIMPGTFVLNTSMNYDEVIEIISNISNSIEEEKTVDEIETSP